jgi:dihydrofolate reductase
MGKLVYSMNVSLDGFVETLDRGLDGALVDEELHTWFNDRARRTDAFLYGRRLYETMAAYWPTAESDPSATGYNRLVGARAEALPAIVQVSVTDAVGGSERTSA